MKCCPLIVAAALFFSSTAIAQASARPSSQVDTNSRDKLVLLMNQVVEAGRNEAYQAYNDDKLSADERRDAQTQFARILIRSGNCKEAQQFIADHPEILASGVERNINSALSSEDRKCATSLADLMWQRWDDPYYIPDGRIGLKFVAAAYLDAGDDPRGRLRFLQAEEELVATGNSRSIWSTLFKATTAYKDTDKFNFYLEFLAEKLSDESLKPPASRRRGLLILFAAKGRDDLLVKFVKENSKDYNDAHAIAKSLANPSPTQIANDKAFKEAFGDEPALNEAGLQSSLSERTIFSRMFRLLRMASMINRKLAGDRPD